MLVNLSHVRPWLYHSYDLKGSSVNRTVLKRGEPARKHKGTLKDNDLHTPFSIDTDQRQQLLRQLQVHGPPSFAALCFKQVPTCLTQADVAFLCHRGIMDYSLLAGVCLDPTSLPPDSSAALSLQAGLHVFPLTLAPPPRHVPEDGASDAASHHELVESSFLSGGTRVL